MVISKLALTLSEEDINAGLSAAFEKMASGTPQGEQLKKIKDPRVALQDGKLTFKCRASMGVLPMPVEAQIRLTPSTDGLALDITLAKVSLMMMGGEAVAAQLMGQLASAVAGKPGLAVNGNTLTVRLATLAQLRNIQLGGRLNEVTIGNHTLALDFS